MCACVYIVCNYIFPVGDLVIRPVDVPYMSSCYVDPYPCINYFWGRGLCYLRGFVYDLYIQLTANCP